MLPLWARIAGYICIGAIFAVWRMWEIAALLTCILVLDLHRELRDLHPRTGSTFRGRGETSLQGEAENFALSGVLFAAFGLLAFAPVTRVDAVVGLSAGSVSGLFVAWIYAKRGEKQIKTHGNLEAWSGLERWSFCCLLVLPFLFLVLILSFLPMSLPSASMTTWGLYCGYSTSSGCFIWFWARRKKRQGFEPLVVVPGSPR